MDITGLHEIKAKINNNFSANLEEVNKLMNFDESVLEMLTSKLDGLSTVAERINVSKNHEFWTRLNNLKTEIAGIHSNNSVNKCYYHAINNQCVVLLVSHFSATLHDLFKNVIEIYIDNSLIDHLDDVGKIEFTVKELIEHKQNEERIGEIILEKDKSKGVNFQDMKSTKRAFENYFQINLLQETSSNEKDIIFAQSARHNIVHNGATINPQFLTRIKAAVGRNLKRDIMFADGQVLEFSKAEIEIIADSMKKFVNFIFGKIESCFQTNTDAVPEMNND